MYDMTNSIEPIPILTGKDAERFLKEKKRVEELKPDSKKPSMVRNFGRNA